ncbi:hypothetical protein DFH08DRAFT_1038249 [Mycena albidolilacea]|uniref:Uncharacterized protein n=1 Tax=Mycena albidolilacea TaxID=1033008 RepID=A0AAD7F1B8_9AGAR|nr:hypothetical protein DFH08DRAFT_1038249 [Mycena albidolilacea]
MAVKGKGITSVTPGHNAERWKGTMIFESLNNLTRYFKISKRQILARKLPSPPNYDAALSKLLKQTITVPKRKVERSTIFILREQPRELPKFSEGMGPFGMPLRTFWNAPLGQDIRFDTDTLEIFELVGSMQLGRNTALLHIACVSLLNFRDSESEPGLPERNSVVRVTSVPSLIFSYFEGRENFRATLFSL